MAIELHDYEIEHLIEWHRNEQWRNANNEDYIDAEDHKKRHLDWEKELVRRKPSPEMAVTEETL